MKIGDKMEKRKTKKEIVKMLLNKNLEIEDEEQLINLLIDSPIAIDVDKEDKEREKFGDILADKLTEHAGSWGFIIGFSLFLITWVILNVYFIKDLDPYPFILLNLVLSCIAALQAPIIMMSQNRQEDKDRDRAEHDYKINLKAELEIKLLSEKIDHLLVHQNKKLLEIQEMQIQYLENIEKQVIQSKDKNDTDQKD